MLRKYACYNDNYGGDYYRTYIFINFVEYFIVHYIVLITNLLLNKFSLKLTEIYIKIDNINLIWRKVVPGFNVSIALHYIKLHFFK